MRRRTPAIVAACVLFLAAGETRAQWRVVAEVPDGRQAPVEVALVENDSGHSLRIYRDEAQNIRGVFAIRGGFDSVNEESCPTFRVDNRRPARLSYEDAPCRVDGKRVYFTLGIAGEPPNGQLSQFMNGSDIVVRYRLRDGHYRETRFTLRRSKYALSSAVGAWEVLHDE